MQTLKYCNHTGDVTPKAYIDSLAAPDFAQVSGFHLVLSPDKVLAGRLPSLLTYLATLGRPFDFSVSMTLTGLPDGDYAFPLREMLVSFEGRQAVPMNVPELSADNAPAISAYMCSAYAAVPALLAAVSPNFRLMAVSCNLLSGDPEDTTENMPSNEGETPAEAAANWADLGVTPSVVIAALAAHATALAGVVDPDVYTAMSYYNPLLANIGHANDGGDFYTLATTAQSEALAAVGRRATIFYPSVGEAGHMPKPVSAAAARTQSFAFQMVGGVADPVAALKDVLQMDPAWGEMPQPILAAAIAGGWNGSAFPG